MDTITIVRIVVGVLYVVGVTLMLSAQKYCQKSTSPAPSRRRFMANGIFAQRAYVEPGRRRVLIAGTLMSIGATVYIIALLTTP